MEGKSSEGGVGLPYLGGYMSPASGFTPLPDLMEVIEERLTIPVIFYPINQRDARKGCECNELPTSQSDIPRLKWRTAAEQETT